MESEDIPSSDALAAAAQTSLTISAQRRLERAPFKQRVLIISIVFHILLLGAAWWALKRFTSLPRLPGVMGNPGGHVTAPGPPDADSIVDDYNRSTAPLEPIDIMLPADGKQARTLKVTAPPPDYMPAVSAIPWAAAGPAEASFFAPAMPVIPMIAIGSALPPPPAARSEAPVPSKAPPASQPQSSAAGSGEKAAVMAGAKMGRQSPGDGAGDSSSHANARNAGGYTPPRPAGANSRRGGIAARNGYDSRGLPMPDYPLAAKERNQEGSVILRIEVHPDGSPGAITVLRDAGYPLLAKAATEAAREANFIPATHHDVPVEGSITVEFKFQLW